MFEKNFVVYGKFFILEQILICHKNLLYYSKKFETMFATKLHIAPNLYKTYKNQTMFLIITAQILFFVAKIKQFDIKYMV